MCRADRAGQLTQAFSGDRDLYGAIHAVDFDFSSFDEHGCLPGKKRHIQVDARRLGSVAQRAVRPVVDTEGNSPRVGVLFEHVVDDQSQELLECSDLFLCQILGSASGVLGECGEGHRHTTQPGGVSVVEGCSITELVRPPLGGGFCLRCD